MPYPIKSKEGYPAQQRYMVPVAALDFGGVCQQQRVQQIGGAAAVFERGIHPAVRRHAGGAGGVCLWLAAGHQAPAADHRLRQ